MHQPKERAEDADEDTSKVIHLPVMGRVPQGKKCGSVTTPDMIAKVHCCYWQRGARSDDGPALGEGHYGSCGHPAYVTPDPTGRRAREAYRIPAPFPATRSNFGCALWSRSWPEPK